jgi:predicted ATPase
MIQSVEIQNFKNIRHQKIDLERLTVFVGPNGCGKTSVLQAIHYSARTLALECKSDEGWWEDHKADSLSLDWLVTRGSNEKIEIRLTTFEGIFDIHLESFGGTVYIGDTPLEYAPIKLSRQSRLLSVNFTSSLLSAPCYSDRKSPLLKSNGSGLPSVLAYMALNDPDGFESLVAEFRKLIPQVRRIRFTKMPVTREETEIVRFGNESIERRSTREYQGDAILFDYENAKGVLAQTVSEGTMLLLGLLTVLLGPDAPDVLLIDDIEHGLHPLAQKQLLETLNQIMERFPDLQILATAHSPYLLDGLKPEQVRMMTIGEDGYSVCGKLTDHPDFEKWKDEMAPGELWSLFGEKWLLDAGVAP